MSAMPTTSRATAEGVFQFDPQVEFYIPSDETKLLMPPLLDHGGKCTLKLPSEDYDGNKNNVVVISDRKRRIVYKHPFEVDANNKPFRNYLKTYSLQYIRDCIDRKETIYDLSLYENSYKAAVRFTPHEDEYILDRARRESHQMNSHLWFVELANAPEMGDHTGESIRSRFRRFLKPKLTYVFQLDEKNEPVKDLNGDFIRVPVDEYQMKIPFTPKDDYLCCHYILEEEFKAKKAFGNTAQIHLDRNAKLTTSSFGAFRRLSKVSGTRHTLNSWRDRYRKYLNPYGVSNYKEYYERCLEKGQTPMAVHVAPPFDSKEFTAVDDNIFAAPQRQQQQQLLHQNRVNAATASTASAASVAAAAVVAAAADKDTSMSDELEDSDNSSEPSDKRKRTRADMGVGNQTIHGAQVQTADLIRRSKRARGLPPSLAGEFKSEETGTDAATEESLSPPVEVPADEGVQEEEDDIEEAEGNEEDDDEEETSNQNENIEALKSASPDLSHVTGVVLKDEGEVKKEAADIEKDNSAPIIYVRVSPGSDEYIPLAAGYVLEWILRGKLFLKNFELTVETTSKLEAMRLHTDDAYEVIQALKLLGFKKQLLHHLLMASSGSITELVEAAIVIVKRMLKHVKSLPRLKFSSVIRVKKIPGLWNHAYDDIVFANTQAIVEAVRHGSANSVRQQLLVDLVEGVEGLPAGLTVGQTVDRIRFLDAYYGRVTLPDNFLIQD